MKWKDSVSFKGLQPQMLLVIARMEELWRGQALVITSANDGTHMQNSLHYQGLALDFRTKDVLLDKQRLLEDVRAALGRQFDVIFEDPGGPNEHMHVEFDPK